MFRPVGSLPAAVYWRRRALLAAVLVAVIVLLWMLFAGDGGAERPDHPAAAGASHGTATPARTPATITPSAGSEGPPADGQDGDGGAGATGVLAGDNGASGAGSGSGEGFEAPPTCPDSALHLSVETDRSAYQIGDHPRISLTLTNTSTAICTRDVGAAEQEALVYVGEPGSDPFWSSNDCNPGGDPEVRAIDVDEVLHFSVTWPAVSSEPGCAGTPVPAGPGDYSVVVRIGTLRSAPARFTLG